jgi:hypothetical protein
LLRPRLILLGQFQVNVIHLNGSFEQYRGLNVVAE